MNCSNCDNNFYNGNNPLGIKECWSKSSAKIVDRIPIGINESPPYKNREPVKVLDCYHTQGTVYVKEESLTEEGYWR